MDLFIFLGYVESMKKLLYTLPKTAMKKVFQRYAAKVPEPLNTQFIDRVNKKTAVQKHEERATKKNSASLFPSGTLSCNRCFYNI